MSEWRFRAVNVGEGGDVVVDWMNEAMKLEQDLEIAKARIRELHGELALNAAMLAKQMDWARESETERDAMQVELLRQGRVIRQLDEQLGSAPALDANHLDRDRQRDAALRELVREERLERRHMYCPYCGEIDHEIGSPVLIAREALKEG